MKPIYQTRLGNWISLAVGTGLTVLFLVFCTEIYELMYYQDEFSNELHNQKMYFVIALLTTLLCWGIAIIYYLVIDRFSNWQSWILTLLVTVFFTPTATFVYSTNSFAENNFDFSTPILNFSIVNIAVTIVLFLIASFSIKGLSVNSETTPF